MSEATSPHPPLDAAAFVQLWAEALSQVLGQISSIEVPCVALAEAPAEMTPAAEADLWVVCTCSGALRGEMSLRLNPETVLRTAQIFMGEAPAPGGEPTAEHREAVIEFFRQVGSLVVTSVKSRWGEVQLRLDSAPGAPSWPDSSTWWVRAGSEQAAASLAELHLSAALGAALRVDHSANTPSPPPAPVETLAAKPPSANPGGSDGKLELLLEVELDMTLRFGGRRLLLREILDLCPGAVVELDRQVQEPVELMLDGKLVARGEVVIVEGNYGLRVTEVMAVRSN